MHVRIVKSYRDIITICDSNLLGKKFEQGKSQLDIKESFYKGGEKTKKETIEIIKNMVQEDATFNIVGEKSINTALETGIINKKGIKTIQNIPVALVLL